MTLSAGTRLGSHEILSLLGSGGMGEVYRAHDSKLKRDVAIKVLRDASVSDPDRLARFHREAELLAALNHPNIGAAYGLEESGGVTAIVLELVEGDTLADRIARGPVPIDEALPLARQIADALDAAHERGIVHRDLKPSNIKITPDGRVKVLDFGLAKMLEHEGAAGALTMSPTLSVHATRAGVILGTAAYMSPEQARGKPVDRRTDVWSFGCVLFEMLTGRRAFDTGDSVSDAIATILTKEPDWTLLPAATPARIRELLARCLRKDAARRLRDIADARLEIDDALSAPGGQPPEASPPPRPRSRHLVFAGLLGVGVGLGVALALTLWRVQRPSDPSAPAMRFIVETPHLTSSRSAGASSVALSPDATQLVYATEAGPLYVRRLDQLEARQIPGTTDALAPFFAPDGQSVAFVAAGQLQKALVAGGTAQPICAVKSFLGGTWGLDGTIVFAELGTGLSRVPASGGSPTALTTVESGEVHSWPSWVSGTWIVYTASRSFAGRPTGSVDAAGQVVAYSVETKERRVLVSGGEQATASGNHLFYRKSGALLTVGFDPAHVTLRGDPAHVAAAQDGFGAIHYAVAGSVFAYVPAGVDRPERKLVWVDRRGGAETIPAPPRDYAFPRISPDGNRIAVNADAHVWLYDSTRGSTSKLTFEGTNLSSVWTPDGTHVTFASAREGGLANIYWTLADGSGGTERLTTSPFFQVPETWSPDGRTLAFSEFQPQTDWDIWMLPLSGRKPQLFLRTPFHDGARSFSPDGRWLAYFSDESGRGEVYVRAYPGPGPKIQVSTQGGGQPLWARNGRELFYRADEAVLSVDVTLQPSFAASKPRELFRGPYHTMISAAQYDISPDGQRFLMILPDPREGAPTQVTVVVKGF